MSCHSLIFTFPYFKDIITHSEERDERERRPSLPSSLFLFSQGRRRVTPVCFSQAHIQQAGREGRHRVGQAGRAMAGIRWQMCKEHSKNAVQSGVSWCREVPYIPKSTEKKKLLGMPPHMWPRWHGGKANVKWAKLHCQQLHV